LIHINKDGIVKMHSRSSNWYRYVFTFCECCVARRVFHVRCKIISPRFVLDVQQPLQSSAGSSTAPCRQERS
jgi:hypothetical protein